MKINRDGLSIINRFPVKKPLATLQEAEAAVTQLVTVPLLSNQFSALVCFVCCRGIPSFARSKLLTYVNDEQPFLAADQFKNWMKQNGKVRKTLKERRRAERMLFLRPVVVTDNGKV